MLEFFRKKNPKGQSIVELTLITPIVIVALMVPADFGMAFFMTHLTQNAVNKYARLGATSDPFDNTLGASMRAEIPKYVSITTSTVTQKTAGSANCMKMVEARGGYRLPFYAVSNYALVRLHGESQRHHHPRCADALRSPALQHHRRCLHGMKPGGKIVFSRFGVFSSLPIVENLLSSWRRRFVAPR